MDRAELEAFGQACDVATQVLHDDAVASRWSEASSLTGLTVGGLAAHLYAATRRFEVALDEELAERPTVIGLPEFYGLNRVGEPDELADGWHPLLRADAERRAAHGPEAVAQRFTDVVARLQDRLPREPADRLIPVWTIPGAATPLATYVATRVVELVVHTDDLAVSVDLAPAPIPTAAATAVIDVFVEMARHRSGDLGVIRAFLAERTRSTDDALRVL